MINRPWAIPLLLGTLVVASGFADFRIRQSPEYAYTEYIPRVMDRSYGAPAIYRVLVPYANTWIVSLTATPSNAPTTGPIPIRMKFFALFMSSRR